MSAQNAELPYVLPAAETLPPLPVAGLGAGRGSRRRWPCWRAANGR